MRRVLILGAGFGGLAAARALRLRLPEQDEVVLVDRRASYVMGLRKWWAIVGRSTLDEGRRELRDLARSGIQFVQGTIEAIDPARRSAVVEGRTIEADAVIVALGAEHVLDALPGFREHVLNPYDSDSVPAVVEALAAFRGGRLGIGIFGVPYTCPPAPYELALLIRESLVERGLQAEVEIFTPQPMSLPVIGQENCSSVEGLLEERGVRFLPDHKAMKVRSGQVVFGTGPRAYDLLLGVPPHRCPGVLAAAGLAAAGGWVKVDLTTMQTSFPGIYAIGDATEIPLANGMALPKAGVFAEAGAETAVEAILSGLSGTVSSRPFDGHGYCYLEAGRGEALEVRGHFLAEPRPQVRVEPPSRDRLVAKEAFERDRLRAWFGK
jgi:sulfide:quinone oxidoreductase